MSTMPPAPLAAPARTPVAPAGSAARATAAEEAAETATVADVFAALVDALTEQLDGAAAEPADGDTAAGDQADASASASGPGGVLLPAAIAPVVRLPEAGGTAEESAAGAGALPEGGAVAEVLATIQPTPTDAEGIATEPLAGSGRSVAALDLPADVEQPGAPLAPPAEHGEVAVGDAEPLPADGAAGALRDDEVAVGSAPGGRAGDHVPGSPDVTATAARVAAAAPTAAPAADVSSAAAGRPAAPALPEQLVEVLTPVRRGPDGDHRMSIQLRPEELGEVRIDVRVRGGEISLNLRADLPATSELLRDSLRELRVALEAAGFRSGDLGVGSHGRGGATPEGSAHRGPGSAAAHPSDSATADAPHARPTASTPTTGLDLRL